MWMWCFIWYLYRKHWLQPLHFNFLPYDFSVGYIYLLYCLYIDFIQHFSLWFPPGQRRTSRPLHTMGFSRHYELLYNAGIQLLHAGRPLAAFDCLIETVQVYSTNPRLWLRLAECCIAVNKGAPVSSSSYNISRLYMDISVSRRQIPPEFWSFT